MSDHNLAEALRQIIYQAERGTLARCEQLARDALASIYEAEQQAGEAVGACLKVIKGELCYRSRDEDQSFGMWVPVAPDSDHGFNNGAEFAPVAAHPQQPLTDRERELLDALIERELHHAAQCDGIANRRMAEKQKGWDMERVALLRKLAGITKDTTK